MHGPDPATDASAFTGRRPRLVGVLLVFIALVVLVGVARTGVADNAGHAVGRAAAVVPAPTISATVTLPPTLPVPEALPENPYEATPQVVLGTIEIPKIGITDELQRGVTLTAINRGPGWWPGTARPGELGNSVIAGHRTTYGRPFYRLNELEPGDQVIITTSAGRFVYEVRAVIAVPEEWIDIAAQSYAHTATLFACHPPGSARERIVAKLRLLDASGQPVDTEAALPPLDAEAQRPDHTLVVRERTTDTAPLSGGDPLSASNG